MSSHPLKTEPYMVADGFINGRDAVNYRCDCGRRFVGMSSYSVHQMRHHE